MSVKLRLQILVILIAACTIIYVHLFVPGPGNGADFVAFYAGAYADAQGLDPFDQATLWQTEKTLYLGGASYHGPMQLDRYLNPPPFALLLQPLTHLPPSTAYWIWVASMFVSAGLGAYLCLVQWPRGPRLLGTAIVACCPAALWDYRLGQNAMLLLPSLGLAFWARSRQRPVLAGLALSGGLVKPQLLLPIALLVILTSPRQERIAITLGFLGGGAFWASITALFDGGIGMYGRWVADLQADSRLLAPQTDIASLPGIYYRLLPETTSHDLNMLAILLALALAAYIAYTMRTEGASAPSLLLGCGVAACYVLLPKVHTGDQVVMVVLLLLLIGPDGKGLLRLPVWLAALACTLAPLAMFHDHHIAGINALPSLLVQFAYLHALASRERQLQPIVDRLTTRMVPERARS